MDNAMEVERQSTPTSSMSEDDVFNQSIHNDFLYDSFNSVEKMLKNGTEKSVKFVELPLKCGMIAVMEHPASFTVHQYVSIQALSGSVSILGYELCPQNRPIKVFSSVKTGLIEIKTETCESVWKRKHNQEELHHLFNNVTEDNMLSTSILSDFGKTSIAVFVKRIPFPPNLKFLEIYFPHALDFKLSKKISLAKYSLQLDEPEYKPIKFNEDVDDLIGNISMSIRSSKLSEVDAPRVVIYGPKNIGKSSLIRYTINKLLSEHSAAYYLDTDPGQTEFTPPGVVSLTKVTQPIIGPSFCHQRSPISMIFTGSITPKSPDMYSKSVAKLMNLYEKKYSDEPLFVNTMGWMEGLGLECLKNVMTVVKPTVLVEILAKGSHSTFEYREFLADEKCFFPVTCSFEQKTSYFPPKERREMSLLSYIGKCQKSYFGAIPLNEIPPYRVSWDKIPIYIFNHKLQPFRMVEAISHSIVALCVVSETSILKSAIPQFPLTLEDDPDNECLGFGLVRAVDETSHLLYIITPLKLDALKKVNAIIKGDIIIPHAVIMTQDIYGEELPYTYHRQKVTEKEVEEEEKKQQDMCSMSLLNVTGFSAPGTKPSGSRLHKPIARRNKRSSFKQC